MQPSVEYSHEVPDGVNLSARQQIRLTVAVSLIAALGENCVSTFLDLLPDAIRKISEAVEK